MNKYQKKIGRIGIISSVIGLALILGYILASPAVEVDSDQNTLPIEKDIDVSSPEEKETFEMTLSERLMSLDQLEFLDLLIESGDLTDIETAENRSTVLIPANTNEINVRSFLIPQEFYTNTIDIPSSITNSRGEDIEVIVENGEIIFVISGDSYLVLEPDLQFDNGSIFIIERN